MSRLSCSSNGCNYLFITPSLTGIPGGILIFLAKIRSAIAVFHRPLFCTPTVCVVAIYRCVESKTLAQPRYMTFIWFFPVEDDGPDLFCFMEYRAESPPPVIKWHVGTRGMRTAFINQYSLRIVRSYSNTTKHICFALSRGLRNGHHRWSTET